MFPKKPPPQATVAPAMAPTPAPSDAPAATPAPTPVAGSDAPAATPAPTPVAGSEADFQEIDAQAQADEAAHREAFPDAPAWYTAAVRRQYRFGYLDADGAVIEQSPLEAAT